MDEHVTPGDAGTHAAGPAPSFRIGSRGSRLALVQARWTSDRLAAIGITSEIVLIRTAGDDRAPDTAWGEGAFVTAIEQALLDGRVDVAVHSAKDVPTIEDGRLTIAAWAVREDPRDALVCRARGQTLASLPRGSRVGTDSPRRGAFLRAVRPDLRIHPLSGNVDTRLRKLDDGESDALVLAVAGLARLGLADRIDQILPIELVVPAPGQGALALQIRADDARARAALAALDDPATRHAVEAERAFLVATGGGCRSPIGAIGSIAEGALTLHVAAERAIELPGRTAAPGGIVRLVATAPVADRLALAQELAARVVSSRRRARVLVTRPANQAGPLVDALTARGVDAAVLPTIAIDDAPARRGLDAALADPIEDSRIVATSPNGVRLALEAVRDRGLDPAAIRWAVVGAASAAILDSAGVTPFVPSRADAASLAAELPVAPGERVVLVRGDLADSSLPAGLEARGAKIVGVVAYRTLEGPEASRDPLAAALDAPLDAITFASGSAVRGLLALAPADRHDHLRSIPSACIGASTAAVAAELGFRVVVQATSQTADALAEAVVEAIADAMRDASAPAPEPAPVPVHGITGGDR